MTPRGIRNHNPLNLRESPGDQTEWEGERAGDDDPAFEEFTSPEYGIRAGFKVLRNYQKIHGLVCVRDMIKRFAPPSENNTESYIKSVSEAMHIDPDLTFDIGDKHHAIEMIAAIIHHENGVQPYSQETILDGINLA